MPTRCHLEPSAGALKKLSQSCHCGGFGVRSNERKSPWVLAFCALSLVVLAVFGCKRHETKDVENRSSSSVAVTASAVSSAASGAETAGAALLHVPADVAPVGQSDTGSADARDSSVLDDTHNVQQTEQVTIDLLEETSAGISPSGEYFEPSDPSSTGDRLRTIDPDYQWLPERTVKENGPYKIGITAMQAWVHLYPDDETPYLGYLRAGRVVDRSESWIAKTVRCPGGWYEVLPHGYICNGNRATLDLDDPIVVASWKEPKRGEGFPYFYVRPASSATYLYFTLPSPKNQLRTEGAKLKEHLAAYPTPRIPNVGLLGEPEPTPAFLMPGNSLPKPYGATKHLRYNVHEGRANPKAAFALMSVHDYEDRLFGLTTELNLLAIDRTTIVRAPKRRGGPIEDLPAGFVRALSIPRYIRNEQGSFVKQGAFEQYSVLDLTGNTVQNYWELRDGSYITAGAAQIIEPRTSFPSFAENDRKWLDISIKNQMLIAYVAKRAVYVTQVSTGLGELADPEKTFATVRGAFTIKSKHLTATMTGSRQADDYELADVPYVQYFHKGYALHGSFWHNNFGRTQSHGCVNLTPDDAAWVFAFTDPQVPDHWHGIVGDDKTRRAVVYVRP